MDTYDPRPMKQIHNTTFREFARGIHDRRRHTPGIAVLDVLMIIAALSALIAAICLFLS